MLQFFVFLKLHRERCQPKLLVLSCNFFVISSISDSCETFNKLEQRIFKLLVMHIQNYAKDKMQISDTNDIKK